MNLVSRGVAFWKQISWKQLNKSWRNFSWSKKYMNVACCKKLWSFIHYKLIYGHLLQFCVFNPLPDRDAFWRLWKMWYLKTWWKMKHLLLRSKCSILHHVFKAIQKYNITFWKKSKIWIKNRKWCHNLYIAYEVKG